MSDGVSTATVNGGLRVIIVAEHASSRFGGEAILPLHYFKRLRERGYDAWLVVHERTRAELMTALPEHGGRIHFVPDLAIHRALYRYSALLPDRVATNTLGWLSHLVTQVLQRRIVRELVREFDVDVVHEPIPVSPKTPSLMFDVGAPVVIGPMNGGMDFPPGFRQRQGAFERWFLRAGRRAASVANRVMPGKRRAALLLVANRRTREALPDSVHAPVVELVENGVDLSLFVPPRERRSAATVPRFAFVGRLVDMKGVDLLLEAICRLPPRLLELHVIGDGPLRASLELQAGSIEPGGVMFHGAVRQTECAKLLGTMDALVLPSLFECGGAVVLEAMAMGLPVVATRWGGPTDYLDDDTGILVDATDREDFIASLSRALARLAQSPELRERLGAAGRRRVEESFDWERKIDRILEIYRQASAKTERDGRAQAQ
jgi:glycosyltransferase involved in cell wall biosynthesis